MPPTGHGGDQPGEGTNACPDIEALEEVAANAAAPIPEATAAHLASCAACRERLEEMRSAHAFLARFRSGAPDARPDEDADRTSAAQHLVTAPGYTVKELVAFGGQGLVYRARQTATGRDVAIKVPIRNTQMRPSTRFRFQREIELTARLNHPGIVQVYGDCQLDDGRIACIMEFVEGKPIDRWASEVREQGAPGVRRIVELICGVSDAIAYAHQHAVMHRDIKPSNVIVTPVGSARVLDFGLAKALDESGAPFSTLTGGFVGTLVYAAPEQVSGGQDENDLRTDVYALGLLLYQALTGRLPHATDAPTLEIVEQIRSAPPPRPSSIADHIGAELDAIVLMALAKEKERRYRSAGAFADDLRRWLADEPVRARFDSRWYVMRKTAWRHRWSISIATAGVIALAIIVGLWFSARGEARRAELARAVRDARTLESHRVQMSEARSMARESFEAGERLVWDALLEPEEVLVREGVEGTTPDGPIVTSPAYWALWEIYMNTPIIGSLLDDVGALVAFADAEHLLIPAEGELQWRDRRTGRLVDRLSVPLRAKAMTCALAPEAGVFVLTDGRGPAIAIDMETRSVSSIGEGPIDAAIVGGRYVATRAGSARAGVIEVWDLTAGPTRRVAIDGLSGFVTMAFDATGEYLALVEIRGRLLLVRSATGEVLLERAAMTEPQLNRVACRGKPGEIIVWGPNAVGVIDVDDGPRLRLVPDDARTLSGRNAAKGFAAAVEGTRYLYATDRQQLGIGDIREPLTKGDVLPGLTLQSYALSPDGRHVALLLAGSRRCAVLDLDPEDPRRLPHRALREQAGRVTIFDVEFSADGSLLYAGAMDGTVRAYDAHDVNAAVRVAEAIDAGVTRIGLLGDTIIAGGHEEGRADARLVRIRRDGERETIAAGYQWFCGMATSRGEAAWALTAEGRLTRIDAATGQTISTDLADQTTHPFRSLAHLPSTDLLLAGHIGGELVLVRDDTLERVGEPLEVGSMRQITTSPSEPDVFATAHDDGTVRLWRLKDGDAPTLTRIGELRSHTGPAFCVAFHPDGNLIASGGGGPERKDVRIWDRHSGRELAALDLFDLGVFDVAFSPDGRWLAAGGECRFDRPEEGGQLFLIDLQAADHRIAGNLEYHIRRFEREHGQPPVNADALRTWAAGITDLGR
jgi:WD40 repeat protein/tRNA A-37 threonylcarbamoyl transferase component Bud32